MNNKVPEFIKTQTDPKKLQTIMENARSQNNETAYRTAFKRLCEVEGMNYDDPLHQDFYKVLAAYEQLLFEKHGKNQKAGYTRRKLKEHSVEKCIEDWALSTQPTQGFDMLVANDMPELTAEYLVVKYNNRFAKNVVDAAKTRLTQAEIDIEGISK